MKQYRCKKKLNTVTLTHDDFVHRTERRNIELIRELNRQFMFARAIAGTGNTRRQSTQTISQWEES